MNTLAKTILVCLITLFTFSCRQESQKSSVKTGNDTAQKATQADYITINGSIGESGEWGSGYLDLDSMLTLNKGTTLKLEIGGEAKMILVRILVQGKSPDQPVGILGKFKVTENRMVEVKLVQDFRNIKQISVHGNPKAWSYSLGASNGKATLVSASWK
jgi:hypothetical protein